MESTFAPWIPSQNTESDQRSPRDSSRIKNTPRELHEAESKVPSCDAVQTALTPPVMIGRSVAIVAGFWLTLLRGSRLRRSCRRKRSSPINRGQAKNHATTLRSHCATSSLLSPSGFPKIREMTKSMSMQNRANGNALNVTFVSRDRSICAGTVRRPALPTSTLPRKVCRFLVHQRLHP